MSFKSCFGSHLQILRKSANLTQEKLSELIGINQRQLSKIETAAHFPTVKNLEKIIQVLELKPKELFDFDYLTERSGKDLLEHNAHSKQDVYYILNQFKKICNNRMSVEFIKHSFAALFNNESLKNLEMMIKGMKIARNID